MRSQSRPLTVLLVLFLGLVSTSTLAQVSAQTLVNYPEVSEDEDAVNLTLYFNILDNAGQVVSSSAVHSATILLDDGNRYDAQVEQPDTPFYITLVLDASGSMGGASQALQQAAIQFINHAPSEARFSVVRFNQQVDVLVENFTADRNRAINAVGEVNPVNMSGTCLYDAVYRAVEVLGTAPPGRRAVILFTDGRDETAQGTRCSTHTYDEVINLASQLNVRVPIYTIGYRGGQEINETELRNFALATGGVSAIGSQQAEIANLFESISTAIDSQWMASTIIYPQLGTRIATLLVTLNDGTFPQPARASATFMVSKSYEMPSGDVALQSSAQVSLLFDLFQYEPSTQSIQVHLGVEGSEQVAEYRFDLKNAATNLLVGEFVFTNQLPNPVEIPVGNLPNGQYLLQAVAIGSDGRVLGRTDDTPFTIINPTPTPVPVGAAVTSVQFNAEEGDFILQLDLAGAEQLGSLQVNLVNSTTNLQERSLTFTPNSTINIPTDGLAGGEYAIIVLAQDLNGQMLSRSSQSVLFIPNTPTPTNTPPPVGAVIESVQYDASISMFRVTLDLLGADQIASLQINLINTRTNLQERTFEISPTSEIQIPIEGLQGAEYTVAVIAQSASGQILNRDMRSVVPPTPTPSPTPSPSATPVQASVRIDAVEAGDSLQEFIVRVSIENADLIRDYQISLTNNSTGLQVASFNVEPSNGAIRVPLTSLVPGDYNMTLRGTDETNRLVAEHSVGVRIAATETPVPTTTAGPTVEPTPEPILSRLSQSENLPIVVPIILVIAAAVIGFAIFLLRKPSKSTGGTAFLSELTGAQQMTDFAAPYSPSVVSDPDATNAQITFDPNATSPVPQLLLPATRLVVERSRDSTRIGQTVIVDQSPFSIGRKGRNLDFDGDSNVSREHADIIFENGTFYIVDRNSAHGTMVDNSPIPKGMAIALYNNVTILLGTTTLLRFETEASSFDSDKTSI